MQVNKAAQIAWKVIIGAFAAMIVSLSAMEAWRSVADFPQYYTAAKLLVDGRGAQVYKPDVVVPLEHQYFPNMNRGEVYFCFPPYTMGVLAPLAALTPQAAHYAWTSLSVIAFLSSLFILKKTFELSASHVLWLALILPVMGPYCQSVIMGQPSFFMLLGLCFALWALRVKNNTVLAVIGLAAMLPKPHLLLPILAYLVGVRKYRLVANLIGIGVLVVGASLLVPGVDAYQNYFEFSKFANENPKIMNLSGCVTIRTQLLRFFPEAYTAIGIISIAAFVAGLAGLFVLGRRFAQREEWLDVAALVTLPVGFVTALYVQPYDLVLFVPSIVVYALVLKERFPRGLWVPLLGIVYGLIFVFPVYVQLYFTKMPFFLLFWMVLGWALIVLVNAVKLSNMRY